MFEQNLHFILVQDFLIFLVAIHPFYMALDQQSCFIFQSLNGIPHSIHPISMFIPFLDADDCADDFVSVS